MDEKLSGIKELCERAKSGGIGFDAFYDKLCGYAEDEDLSGDAACVIEDALMELEMAEGSKRALKGAAELILAGLEKIK